MQDKGWMIVRVLLNRYHKGAAESVLKGLPEEDASKVLALPFESNDLQPAFAQPLQSLQNVHYSWLVSKFQNLPESKRFLALSLLPESMASKLCLTLKETSEPITFSKPIRSFLLSRFSSIFQLDDVSPLEYLPPTDLAFVADLKKNKILEVIDYLGIYDLVEEVHHIVDKKILESIYKCLSQKKHLFLKRNLHQREKLVTQRLQLEHWDGDCQKLAKLLHHRGIVRLGYALSGQHPDFLWHVTHTLDIGRGEKLARYSHHEEIPGVTKALKKQVKTVVDFLKGKT